MADLSTVELQIVQPETSNEVPQVKKVYLIVRGDEPVRLGSGRYAYVVAAAGNADLRTAQEFYALKFLKFDKDSSAVSKNARTRFYEELDKTVRFQSARGTIVRCVGCSRVLELPPFAFESKEDRVKNERAFEDRFGVKDQNGATVRNVYQETALDNTKAIRGRVNASFLGDIQGEFYAMGAEEGTLDDLLFDNRPWSQRPIFSVWARLRERLEELLVDETAVTRFLETIRNPDHLRHISPRDATRLEQSKRSRPRPEKPANNGGLALMNYIGAYSPTTKNRIAVSLAAALVDTVRDLHTARADDGKRFPDGWLAHRDLKPGNFLLSYARNKNFELRISDLGYTVGSEAAGGFGPTLDASMREPGVLAPGSYLFRAPEQISGSVEIRFHVDDAENGVISFSDIGAVASPQVGDCIECQELEFLIGKSAPVADRVRGTKVLVTEVDYGADRGATGDEPVRITVDGSIVTRDKSGEDDWYVGYINRTSGQHTDIFAFGCILYLIASGGRNPERFYMRCIENLLKEDRVAREAIDLRQPSGESAALAERRPLEFLQDDCFSLALALCCDDPDAIADDVARYIDAPREDVEMLRTAPAVEFGAAQKAVGNAPLSRLGTVRLVRPSVFECLARQPMHRHRPRLARLPRTARPNLALLERYLELLRESETVQRYLRDVNGFGLPFPIVYEVVRCVVRDRPDSYVRRPDPAKCSFHQVDCHLIAKSIKANLDYILNDLASVKPRLDEFATLGDGAALLVRLRVCHGKRQVRQQRSATPMREAPPDRDKTATPKRLSRGGAEAGE